MAQPSPLFLGIDPGKSGGFAVLFDDKVYLASMGDDDATVWAQVSYALTQPIPPSPQRTTVAALERVTGTVGGGPPCPTCKQQRNKSPGASMFNFGWSYGGLRMALVASGLTHSERPKPNTFVDVAAKTWQPALRIDKRRKGETDTDWKNRLKWNAQRLFPEDEYPGLKITLSTCDALLIALYVKRLYLGIL